MRNDVTVAAIIPALNEEHSIGKVLAAIPSWVDDVVVVDNGSTDKTAEVARAHGARVISEPRRGYGTACLSGIAALENPDVVVFLDADFSDYPEEMSLLVEPIMQDEADLVIGSRTLGRHETGSLTPHARFGNWLACALIRLFWNMSFTDLGPFRAIRFHSLKQLGMRDPNYGWTVEMQIKAARLGVRVKEAPVSYRRRIGKSKVSGTIRGVIGAGTKILSTIFLAALDLHRNSGRNARRLIVFARYPRPGKTKTRLVPALGPHGAAGLQQRMTEHAMARVREFMMKGCASVDVHYEGGTTRLMKQWLGGGVSYCRQGHGDLGVRMAHAFQGAFKSGAAFAVMVGTDCPGLTPAHLEDAFDALDRNDVVLGPASDGGYYLIGIHQTIPQLFGDIPWGTGGVLERTLRIARDLGLSVKLVGMLDDVDRPEDLGIWEREAERMRSRSSRISVVIPVLNEAATIAAALTSTQGVSGVEVIVVDGGSGDETVEIARRFEVKLCSCGPGRARQMNAGAAEATGDVLLFLHADTRLPNGFEQSIRDALARPGAAGGAFELRIDSPGRSLRLIERVATWRSKCLRMPYGDQALFLKASLFRAMGGFPDIPIMEDFEFVRRLRQHGEIVIARAPVRTSARRWLTLGPLRTTLVNQAVIAAYYAGFSLRCIARWYDRQCFLH